MIRTSLIGPWLMTSRLSRTCFSTSVNLLKKKTPKLAKVGGERLTPAQKLDFFLVLDFEATCDFKEANDRILPKEIIEFPVLKVNAKTFDIDATFHTYVQPRKNPVLTPFCTELTGIVQDMVDGQSYIEDVIKNFDVWMAENGLLDPSVKSSFVTCGDWDLNIMLPAQFQYFNLPLPAYFSTWINIKGSFADCTTKYVRGLKHVLFELGLEHEGRLHSGIDDCQNIVLIIKTLAERGLVFEINSKRS